MSTPTNLFSGHEQKSNVLLTPIRAISFNNFYLPETFHVTSRRNARRLNSSVIQRRAGVYQQTTYKAPIELQIQGRVYTGQVSVGGTALTCDEIIDAILSRFETESDERLHLRSDRFYNARLKDNRTTYLVNTNNNTADLHLSFTISDPFQYATNLSSIANLTSQGNERNTITITNNGSLDTPLNITLTIHRQLPTVEVQLFNTADTITSTTNPTTKMTLDSPGEQANNRNGYYQINDTITLDSNELELTYTPVTPSEENDRIAGPIFHHIKNESPIQNLPINITPGTIQIGIQAYGAATNTGNSITAAFKLRERWT